MSPLKSIVHHHAPMLQEDTKGMEKNERTTPIHGNIYPNVCKRGLNTSCPTKGNAWWMETHHVPRKGTRGKFHSFMSYLESI
jgi:hypothetical protein